MLIIEGPQLGIKTLSLTALHAAPSTLQGRLDDQILAQRGHPVVKTGCVSYKEECSMVAVMGR